MMTGAQYRASLQDGRTLFRQGRRIADLAAEPWLSVPLEHVSETYDRYFVPGAEAVNPLFDAPRSREALRARIPDLLALDELTYLTYQCLMTLQTAAARMADDAPDFVKRIDAYVADAKRRDIRLVECITDAKGHRSRKPAQQSDPDAYVHVVERAPDGVLVRGAKLHITGTALAHELMVMPTKAMSTGEEPYAIAFAIPVNAPGVKAVNVSYYPHDDPRDAPVSSRRTMPEAFVILDDVFVPYERVFLDGQVEHAAVFAHSLGLWERLGGTSLMVQQADELVGFACLIAEANGVERIPHVREKIAELIVHATLLRGNLEAALATAEQDADGNYFPNELYTNAARYLAASGYSAAVQRLHDIAGGSVVTAPATADLDNDEIGALLHKYMAGSDVMSGGERNQLFHAIRDLTASNYGGWWQVVNLHSGGGLYAQRLVTRKHYDMSRAKALARAAAGMPAAD